MPPKITPPLIRMLLLQTPFLVPTQKRCHLQFVEGSLKSKVKARFVPGFQIEIIPLAWDCPY